MPQKIIQPLVGHRCAAPLICDGVLSVPNNEFSPADVTGLGVWLDSADADTVLTSVSPDVVATAGQAVRRWVDKSGNGYHMNQMTGLNQPVYRTSEINSQNALEFDGTNDLMLGTLPNFATCTIFQVHLSTKTAGQLWLGSANSIFNYATVTQQASSDTNVTRNFGTPTFRVDGQAVTFANRGAAYTSLVTGTAKVLCIIGASLAMWSKATGELSLGYISLPSFGPGGNVCELLIYDGALGSDDIASIESYLATKWGATLA